MRELDELVARVASIDIEAERDLQVIEVMAAEIHAIESHIDDTDPQACYLVGYCWYNLDDHWRASKRWLRRALELNQSHVPARVYLGHALFDDGEYAEAQSMFCSVLRVLTGPAWRRLKVEELEVCCELYVSKGERGTAEAEKLLKQYEASPEEDAALPAEIIRCVAHLCDVSENQLGLRRLTAAVMSYVDRTGRRDCFAAELARMERHSGMASL